mgnify:CR=1 FL=1
MSKEKWPPSPLYVQVGAELGIEAGRWIADLRAQNPSPSWQRISRLLYTETGIEVSHETIRSYGTRYEDRNGKVTA